MGAIVADAAPELILTEDRLLHRLPENAPRALSVDPIARSPAAERPGEPSGAGPGDAAFVFYTTGSTGSPNGVVITHRGRIDRLAWEIGAYSVTPRDRMLVRSSTSFARIVKELFWPLLSGATAVLADPPRRRDPAYLAALIERRGVTFAIFVPSQLAMLLEEPRFGGPGTSLRLVLAEGEALPPRVEERFHEHTDGVELRDAYGLTEVSTVAVRRCGGERSVRFPIGSPAGLPVHVLDADLRLVAPGEAGDLYVGGPAISPGHLRRPGATERRWAPDPFAPNPGALMLRTGDRARWWRPGELEYLGRADSQVKVRGFRVEPGEVEAAVRDHPGVRAAAVVAEERPAGCRLAAYVVASDAPEPATADVRRHLAERVPGYMLPARWVWLDALPLTPNGKVDRLALARSPDEPRAAEPPRTPTEDELAGLWARLLGVSRVGPQDDFFALGGDSVLAAAMSVEVGRRFGRSLPLGTLVHASTLAGLAALLEAPAEDESRSPLVTMQARGEGAPFVCVHGMYGNVLAFRELAAALGDRRPFVAVQALGLTGEDPVPNSVEDMAAAYAAALREARPEGAYLLGGYSFGGMVALEMARVLEEEGAEVPLVAMLDTTAPRLHRGQPPFYYEVPLTLRTRPALGGSPRRQHVLDRVVGDGPAGMRSWWRMRELGDGVPESFWAVARACAGAARTYRPRPYDGRVTLLRSGGESSRLGLEPELGWGEVVRGGLSIDDVAGSHVTLLSRPWVEGLARVLGTRMEEAEADRSLPTPAPSAPP